MELRSACLQAVLRAEAPLLVEILTIVYQGVSPKDLAATSEAEARTRIPTSATADACSKASMQGLPQVHTQSSPDVCCQGGPNNTQSMADEGAVGGGGPATQGDAAFGRPIPPPPPWRRVCADPWAQRHGAQHPAQCAAAPVPAGPPRPQAQDKAHGAPFLELVMVDETAKKFVFI